MSARELGAETIDASELSRCGLLVSAKGPPNATSLSRARCTAPAVHPFGALSFTEPALRWEPCGTTAFTARQHSIL